MLELLVAIGGSSSLHATDDFQFSFGSCYMSLVPVARGGHKLTLFSFGSCYRSLQVEAS